MKLSVFLLLCMFEVRALMTTIRDADDEKLVSATVNIIDKCFIASQSWSDILFVGDISSLISRKLHERSKNCFFTATKSFGSGEGNDKDEPPYQIERNDSRTFVETNGEPAAVVISANTVAELESQLIYLKIGTLTLWKTRMPHLVVVPDLTCDEVLYNEMLKITWKFWILDVVILCSVGDASVGNIREMNLYTFNPFTDQGSTVWHLIRNETVEVPLHLLTFHHSWHVLRRAYTQIKFSRECKNVYFDKTKNLGGYVIPVSLWQLHPLLITFDNTSRFGSLHGSDGHTLRVLAEKLNFVVYQIPLPTSDTFGQRLANGTYTGILQDLFEGRSNLGIASRYMMRIPGLESTYPHGISGLCFMTRVGEKNSGWSNLFNSSLDPFFRYVIGIVVATVFFYFQNSRRDFIWGFMNAHRLILGTALCETPKSMKWRMPLCGAFIVVLIVNNLFVSQLISLITTPTFSANINTIKQLIEGDFPVYGYSHSISELRSEKLLARFHRINNPQECTSTIEVDRGQRACIGDCIRAEMIQLISRFTHTGTEKIVEFHQVYQVTSGWPLLRRYDLEVQRTVESGLREKWHSDVMRRMEVSTWQRRRAATTPPFKTLVLNELSILFFMLMLGLSGASMAFIAEYFSSKRSR